mmetsp:Transcript_100215/g.188888  ORF Transcript_100215/g.188888 Transcript_100215/m.188888 type:complete len:210 (-) Transcript_100215:78-707(-)
MKRCGRAVLLLLAPIRGSIASLKLRRTAVTSEVHQPTAIPRTSDGKREAPTNDLHWRPPAPSGEQPVTGTSTCDPMCSPLELCWQGQCVYRPWMYSFEARNSCYANPSLPGLSVTEQNACRSDYAISSHDACLSRAKYCQWRTDAPIWYRRILNEQDRKEYAKWKVSQEMAEPEENGIDVIKKILRSAPPPGNPTYGIVLPSHRLYNNE